MLTRAQLISGDTNNGVVLAGQPQGVRPGGTGITIDTNGIISVNASTITGVMKLNNTGAYNSYIWPASPINKKFLQTDGAGLLSWSDPSGFAVVTVQSQPAPTPADVGELWFDCTTGTLNVYQNCVGTPSPNWFNVAQPGLPVLPSNTSAAPAFTGGNGTQATPYDCTVTTAGVGTSVFVINVVTIVGLAPFQFVPIVDLNAVTNGGRFSFTNNYADASGSLTFQTAFTDQPSSPPSTSYTAAIKVGYGTVYVDAIVNVVTALTVTGGTITGPAYSGNQLTYTPGTPSGGSSPYTLAYQWLRNGVAIPSATALTYTLVPADVGTTITAKTTVTDAASQTASGTSNSIGPIAAAAATLTITSAGSIAPSSNVAVGAVLTYTTGTFTGGVPTVTASWVWKRAGVAIAGTANAATYTTVTADAGQALTVTYTVTDSATPTAATANQTTTSVTPTTPFIPAVWTPTPSNGMDSNPGGQSGTYNGTATSITTTGCVEASVNGGAYSIGTQAITSGQSLAVRWASTSGCGGAASGTTITGTITDGTYTNSYSLAVNRKPTAFSFTAGSTSAPLSSVQTSNTVTITGINSVSYVTVGSLTAGASTLQASINGGGFVAIPASTSTTLPIVTGETLQIRFTTGSTASTTYTAVVNIGDGDAVQFTASSPGFVVINTSSPVFPSTTFAPSAGPTASPANTVLTGSPALNGTATATWADGTTSLTATGSLEFQVNGGGYTQTSTAVANGNTVDLRWNPTAAASAADAASLTGTLTNSTYTNTYTLVVDKQPSAYTWTDQTSVTASSTVTSNVVTIAGINCPAELTYTAGATNTLTSVQASIDGGAFTNIPTSSPGLVINPADAAGTAATTIQLRATVGAGVSTAYTLTTNIGKGAAVVTDEWSVTTAAIPASITTPSITSPANNTTNLNPALNTPAGIPLVGDTYTPLNGAGATQTSSTWEVYKANQINPETSAITGVTQNAAVAWTDPGSVGSNNTYSVWAGGGFYYLGQNDQVLILNGTGTGSSAVSASLSSSVTAGAAGGGKVIAGGYNGNVSLSTGGGAFSYVTNAPGAKITAAAYGNGVFTIAFSPAGIKSSVNGTTWTGNYGTTFNVINSIIYANGIFVGVADGGGIYTSPDGVNWTTRTSGTTLAITGVAFSNGIFAAVGGASGVRTSTDGVTWTFRSSLTFSNTPSIAGGPSGFVILGNGGNAYVSVNGTSWTSQTVDSSGPLLWIAYGSVGFMAVKDNTAKQLVSSNPNGSTTLALTNNTNLSNMVVGDSVIEVGGGADASGAIVSIGATSLTVSSSTAWTNGATVKDTTRTITAPAPTTEPPNATNYTAITGSPFTVSAAPFTTVNVLQTALAISSTYYARVKYATTNATAATSSFSGWSSFGTSSSFAISPGYAYGGGYFGGQINDGGTIYNLIVAPVTAGSLNGQNGGSSPTPIQYKTSSSADAPSATVQNDVYGGPTTDLFKASTAHPAFSTFINGATGPNAGAFNLTTGGAGGGTGIGGFNDWYLPAKNELEILYYNLKPNTTVNNTVSGINPNAVPARASNYTAGNPAQTANALFAGGAQAFSTAANAYWSSSENSSNTTGARRQVFSNGTQNGDVKTGPNYARAIRRISA